MAAPYYKSSRREQGISQIGIQAPTHTSGRRLGFSLILIYQDQSQKRFSVFRFKRYDPGKLASIIEALGWELVVILPFGPNSTVPVQALLLFRRVSLSTPN